MKSQRGCLLAVSGLFCWLVAHGFPFLDRSILAAFYGCLNADFYLTVGYCICHPLLVQGVVKLFCCHPVCAVIVGYFVLLYGSEPPVFFDSCYPANAGIGSDDIMGSIWL